MRLYMTADGTVVGTQKDAGKGRSELNVPTDKAGLIEFLNTYRPLPVGSDDPQPTFAGKPQPVRTHIPDPIVKPMSNDEATTWERPKQPPVFSAGPDVDTICETSHDLEGHQLGNVAHAVACRFKELAK